MLLGLSTTVLPGDAQTDMSTAALASQPRHVVVALDVATKGLAFQRRSVVSTTTYPKMFSDVVFDGAGSDGVLKGERFAFWTLWDELSPTAVERSALEAMPYLRGSGLGTLMRHG